MDKKVSTIDSPRIIIFLLYKNVWLEVNRVIIIREKNKSYSILFFNYGKRLMLHLL